MAKFQLNGFSRLAFLEPANRDAFLQALNISPNYDYYPGELEQRLKDAGTYGMLQEFEKTGKVPDIVKQQRPDLAQRLEALPKDRNDLINSYLKQTQDESALSDQELQQKLGGLQELGSKPSGFDYDKFSQAIYGMLKADPTFKQFKDETLGHISRYLSPAIKNGESPNLDLIKETFKAGGQKIDDESLKRLTNLVSNQFTPLVKDEQFLTGEPKPFTQEQQNIQDLLTSRSNQAATEEQLNSYIQGLPAELASSRNDFLAARANQAAQQFQQQLIPRSLEAANVRGLLKGGGGGGDIQDLISAQGFNIQSDLQGIQSQLEAQDLQLYADAAYKNKLRQLLETSTDVQSTLANERRNLLNDRQNNFQMQQNALDQSLQSKLNTVSYERSLAQQARDLEANRNATERAQQQSTGSSIGTTAGMIGGGIVGGILTAGNPAGIAAGASIGGGVGGGAGGNLFPTRV